MTYEEILAIQIEEYPDSIIITPEELMTFHNTFTKQSIEDHMTEFPESVCYYLPSEKHGALPTTNCNGIRYGFAENYVSLPPIKVIGEIHG